MIDRKLCTAGFGYFLSWPCPTCGKGTLELEKDMIRHGSAANVAFGIDEGYLMRSDDHGAFSAILKCSNKSCRQSIATLGDYAARETGETQWSYEHRYFFRSFHPALKLIDVPEGTPQPILKALLRSFGLFWSDHQACAGALRVAIDSLAEELGQPRKVSGKPVNLGTRLSRLKVTHPDVVEAADAIKNVGNDGAHGDAVEQNRLLDCYELLEIELRRLFNNDIARRRALIDGIKK